MSTLAKLLLGVGDAAYSIGDYVASEGGYYFGVMSQADGDYAYFIAPISAEQSAYWSADADRFKQAGAYSELDGMTNSVKAAALGAGWSAAYYCRNYTGGGKTDWFLWAREEAELAIRTLSPIANGSVSTTFGAVPESIPPYPAFSVMPSQASSSPSFVSGGSQAFSTAQTYWCSGPESSGNCAGVSFNTGAYANYSKGTALRLVRPIRKVRIKARTRQDVIGMDIQSGTFSWIVPDGVTSVSVLCVNAGANGTTGQDGRYGVAGNGSAGGANGPARYLNDISVTPGQVITCQVGNAASPGTSFGAFVSGTSGGTAVALSPASPSSGAMGGNGTSSANGANGTGHKGYILTEPVTNQGYNATDAGGWPGGGGGGGGGGNGATVGTNHPGSPGGGGGNGAIRIMWPGTRRQYPSTDTADEFEA